MTGNTLGPVPGFILGPMPGNILGPVPGNTLGPVPGRGLVAIVIGALFALGACSSADSEANSGSAGSDSESAAAGVETDDPTVEPEWTGAPLNPFDLRSGQCFNEASWIDAEQDRRISITAAIDCAEPHDKEVYFEAEFPAPAGAPFPGDTAMTAWSTELCYEAFEPFVGREYELSIYGIDFLQPTQETFEHPVGRHRRVSCYLYDTSGEQMTDSARLSGL